jgi:hypothetical protein
MGSLSESIAEASSRTSASIDFNPDSCLYKPALHVAARPLSIGHAA